MPDPIIPSGDDDAARRARTPLTCEFCGCRLTATGDVMGMSQRAKELRDAGDALADAQTETARLTAKLAETEAQIAALQAARPAPPAAETW